MEHHQNFVAMAGKGLIDGIVHHLVDEMVQTPRACGADIHPRPLPNRFQTFQNLDLLGAVGGLDSRGVAHALAGLGWMEGGAADTTAKGVGRVSA